MFLVDLRVLRFQRRCQWACHTHLRMTSAEDFSVTSSVWSLWRRGARGLWQPCGETAAQKVLILWFSWCGLCPLGRAKLTPCPRELDSEASAWWVEPGWHTRHRGPMRQQLLFGCIPPSSSLLSASFMTHSIPDFVSSFSSVQLLSHVWLFATPWTVALQVSLSITNSWSLLKLMSRELSMPSYYLILCRPLLLPPSIFPSIRVFSNESDLFIRWPKYWSFSFNISPSNECSGLISFRMDWLDLFAVQGTLKSLLQHHSSKASILQPSAFFIVQLSHLRSSLGFLNSSKNNLLSKSSKQLAESSKHARIFSSSSP